MTLLPNPPGAAVPGQCEGPRSIDSWVIWSRRSVSTPIFGIWIRPMIWIGRRTDGSGTSSGTSSVVSTGAGATATGGAGGAVVVVVVVAGRTARARTSLAGIDAVRGRGPCGNRGSGAVAAVATRSATTATNAVRASHQPGVAPRRARDSGLGVDESMVSFGPAGPGWARARVERLCAQPYSAVPFASASTRLRQGGASEPLFRFGLLCERSGDSRGARDSGRLVTPERGAPDDLGLP